MQPTQKLSQSIRDYKNGNADAFNILYEESNKYIYTCIYKVMSGNDNAQDIIYDIMQDTYVEISKSIEQLAEEERFLSWAGTIATRKCYAYLKKNKKYVLLNEEDDTFDALADSDDIIPEEVMQDREKQRLVREIIENQLTEMQKLCIIAYYYNEQKQSEIAQELGIPENTVKTNLSRAKAKIKEGVLDLEKNKGTKLYSFAPLFVLLFTEDIMAAEVPAEVGVSVVSGVAETIKVASVVETATATAGATTSATTKAGLLGKIAAASVKTKILMAVATVSVAGTVGGGAMIASQNGLFGNASAVSEEQTLDAGQELEEDQVIEDNLETEEVLETEMEETTEANVVEEVEDLNASYIDYTYYSSMRDETVHFRVANVPDEVWNGECRDGAEALVRRSLIEREKDVYEKFYLHHV